VGELVTGFGNLSPAYPDAPIIVHVIKPDGSVIDLQVVTSSKGAFNFTFTPEVAGNWSFVAQWNSDKSYYSSAYSTPIFMEATAATENQPILEYIYAVAIGLAAISVILFGYVYIKRTRK